MKNIFVILNLIILAALAPFQSFAQVIETYGESRSTTFGRTPGIMVEISGDSARQVMVKLDVDQRLKPNGQIEKRGQNIICVLEQLKTKCIMRFNNDGSSSDWH